MEQINIQEPIKIIAIIGSPRKGGNTDVLVREAGKKAEALGAEVEYIELRKLKIRDCIACEKCAETMQCVVKDDMQDLYPKLEKAQGIILGSPTYFYSVTGIMKCFLDRLYAYELFDPENRHVWMGAMENGIARFGLTIAMGEQSNAKDLGFTSAIMRDTLMAIGYRSVDNLALPDLVYKGDALEDQEALRRAATGGEKLVKSCLLARKYWQK